MSFEPIEYTDDFERWWEVYWEFSPIFSGLYKTVAFHAWTAAKTQPEPIPFKVGDVVEGVLIGFPDEKRRGRFLGYRKENTDIGTIEDPGRSPWYVVKGTIIPLESAKRHAHTPDGEA